MRPILAALIAIACCLAPAAYAQHAKSSAGGLSDKQKADILEKQKERKSTSDAYDATIKQIPNSDKKLDPWGNMRQPSNNPSAR
jgi:hypothetical protein